MKCCSLVLTSRTGIRTGYQARLVKLWERLGVNVVISTCNIAHEGETRKLIEDAKSRGPIGGIFHLAMVLRDCLFEDQTVENFKGSAAAKYWGTRNLDKVTRELCDSNMRWSVLLIINEI